MKNISKILIANRGEIAARIIGACKGLGIESVAAVSEADRESLPATMADRSVCIGPSRPLDSYLKIDTLIATGNDRIQTIERMKFALNNFVVSGVETNIPFHKLLMEHPDFIKGNISTRWLEDTVLPKIRSLP